MIVLGMVSGSLVVSEVVFPFVGGSCGSSIFRCVFWCGFMFRTLLGVVLDIAVFLDWFQVWLWSLGMVLG